ncbi:MAG: DUF1698 domain-containing protein [Candidatus Eremiobacteraeota bacterium]|nr:DUF1698 domain-containing protein [Candidatus Eremiobacteraeota bacterium]
MAETVAELQARVDACPWWHTIDFGNGVVSKGEQRLERMQLKSDRVFTRLDLNGKSVLDLGTAQGGFALEAWRRGARPVVCVDLFAEENHRAFNLVKELTGAELAYVDHNLNTPDIDLSFLGEFDVVLALGLIYHLSHPLAAIRAMSKITREVLVIETQIETKITERPLMVYIPKGFAGMPNERWYPNVACVVEMLKSTEQFATVEITPGVHAERQIFHAYRKPQ